MKTKKKRESMNRSSKEFLKTKSSSRRKRKFFRTASSRWPLTSSICNRGMKTLSRKTEISRNSRPNTKANKKPTVAPQCSKRSLNTKRTQIARTSSSSRVTWMTTGESICRCWTTQIKANQWATYHLGKMIRRKLWSPPKCPCDTPMKKWKKVS